MRAVWSLKSRVSAGEYRANTAELRDLETLEKISKLLVLVEGLNQTFGGLHELVAKLFNAELICAQSVIIAALS